MSATENVETKSYLATIASVERDLAARFRDKLKVNEYLNRFLVSFQGNKAVNGNRWHSYKEGFSANLIKYIIDQIGPSHGRLLDPFVGSGTALFVASDLGLDSVGIELLPSSAEIIDVRRELRTTDSHVIASALLEFAKSRVWEQPGQTVKFDHLVVTHGAFPPKEEENLGRFLFEVNCLPNSLVRKALRFAALSVLESISYTRKDGQYLRWDWRSGKKAGQKPFYKTKILGFTTAIISKIEQIAGDLVQKRLDEMDFSSTTPGNVELIRGSCLEILPTLPPASFDGLITSPPYCNRYDYTRTYALELAFLGVSEEQLKRYRQAMLSCTVENRDKEWLETTLDVQLYEPASSAFHRQQLLQLILEYLEHCRDHKLLNNNGVPRMVRNYFKEMAVVIFEAAQVLKPGAPFVMVNDNVRYEGAHIPVDLILSDIAQQAGFEIETIWILPRGKGNSSQQMGKYGRQELRKCVYVWRLKARPTS